MAKTARGKKSPKEKAKAAKDLLANAPSILKEVLNALIFKKCKAREIPLFEPNGT
jgi:hypothetical protein